MIRISSILAMLASLMLAAAASAEPSAPAGQVIGTWKNPKSTVVVRTESCGASLCGTVVWAAQEAIADARDGGEEHLIGKQLLQDYRLDSPGHWTGSVYVPNMGHSFYSTIVQKGPDRLVIAGCILHGLICRHQEWSRV